MAMTNLQTFYLPKSITATQSNIDLGHQMIQSWRTDGIFQIATSTIQDRKVQNAFEASRRFFRMPLGFKSQRISDLTYSGYIASGEEITAGESDYSEIFTLCKDVPLDDVCVQKQWPCHGPVPWPNHDYQQNMTIFMDELGLIGEKLLKLVALGLEVDNEYIHYGTHFTNMFMRCYPDRITTRRIQDEDRLSVLALLRNQALANTYSFREARSYQSSQR